MKKFCKDCNSFITGHDNPIRCRSCAQKLNKKGILHSLETKRKMSLAKQGKKHWNYKDGRSIIPYFCIDCNIEISRQTKTHLCKPCAMKHREITNTTRQKLSLSHGGTGIPYEFDEYGADFDSSLKEQIRQKDHYKCQICGCSQLENGRQLDIHHIDYNKKNNKFYNLITLCISCHSKTNFNRTYWKEFFVGVISEA
jgi:hypothetical protein